VKVLANHEMQEMEDPDLEVTKQLSKETESLTDQTDGKK
jgi:hypothetical protein